MTHFTASVRSEPPDPVGISPHRASQPRHETPADWRTSACGERCRLDRVIVVGGVGTHQGVVERAYHDHAAYEARLEQRLEELTEALDLRRHAGRMIRTGPLTIDLLACTVEIAGVGRVPLSVLEWEALALLARQVGQVVRREVFVERFWPGGQVVEIRPGPTFAGRCPLFHALRVIVSRLRARLAPYGHLIETRLRIGYCLLESAPEVG